MTARISVDEALDLIRSSVASLSVETLDLLYSPAAGRVTACELWAAVNSPPFDCSAMDGFALASANTAGASVGAPALLGLGKAIPAQGAIMGLVRGTAAPISTGAPLPTGADAVVPQERATRLGDMLQVAQAVPVGSNVRKAGEDYRAGQRLISAGTVLKEDDIGALLSCGVTWAAVRWRPRVALLSTGSEFAPSSRRAAKRFDVNGPMLAAACDGLGLRHRRLGPVADRQDAIEQLLAAILSERADDIIISTAGVSAGLFDLVRPALERIGADVLFHGVAMRPGKPILFARLPDGRPFLGLPGNPVAALAGFRFFATAAFRGLMELPAEQGRDVSVDIEARSGLTLFLRGRTEIGGADVQILDRQNSHILSSVREANCWIRVDEVGGRSRARLFSKYASFDDFGTDGAAGPAVADLAEQLGV